VAAEGVGVARQRDVRWGPSLCGLRGLYIVPALYFLDFFSVHCHSGEFKIGLGGTIRHRVYAIYFLVVLYFCYVVNKNEPCTLHSLTVRLVS